MVYAAAAESTPPPKLPSDPLPIGVTVSVVFHKVSIAGVDVALAHASVIVIQTKSAVAPAHSIFVVGPSRIDAVVYCEGEGEGEGKAILPKRISRYRKAGPHGCAMLKSQKSKANTSDHTKAMATK